MKLLEEIIEGASGEEMALSTLLRKCLVLASRLGSQPVEDWVEWELEGYPATAPVPDYRNLNLVIRVSMHDMVRRAEGWPVPTEFLDENGKNFTTHTYGKGVGSIDEMLSDPEQSPTFLVGNLLAYLQSLKFTDMEIVSAWCECDRSQVKNILDTVRLRVLKFALALSKEIPDAGDAKNDEVTVSQQANNIFETHVYGSGNVIGLVDNSLVQIDVRSGDIESLKTFLQSRGVEGPDLEELQEALEAEPEAETESFGPKVAKWISGMVGKAADGTWQIGTGAAGGLLAEVFKKFYGL